MQLRLIRHATMILTTKAGKILVDPMFSAAGAMSTVDNSANNRRNPLVDLPVSIADLLKVDAVLLTHTHRDHFDGAAMESLPKDISVFCQPADEQKLQAMNFSGLSAVSTFVDWNGLRITRTGGEHGTGDIGRKMGTVAGYILQQPGEPTVYIAGDTVWCPAVEQALAAFHPDVVVVFAGAAQFLSGGPITMQTQDIVAILRHLPAAKVVAVHMEAFNHCLLTREALREQLSNAGVAQRVTIPADGETIQF